ncbi:MAG: hypothetical protein EOM07_03030 [Clostridia bacterium]|nr:hypothetical protein [Clostridia bacterium]
MSTCPVAAPSARSFDFAIDVTSPRPSFVIAPASAGSSAGSSTGVSAGVSAGSSTGVSAGVSAGSSFAAHPANTENASTDDKTNDSIFFMFPCPSMSFYILY